MGDTLAILSNHYEKAFSNYIRSLRVGCIAVDESQRSWDDCQTIKSLDFIVTPPGVHFLLVDVKGRKVPRAGRSLDNWATQDDIDSLGRWEATFGPTALALLVFVYELNESAARGRFTDSFEDQERSYGILSVPLCEYRQHLRRRSPRWQTVSIPRGTFRHVARPFSHWLR